MTTSKRLEENGITRAQYARIQKATRLAIGCTNKDNSENLHWETVRNKVYHAVQYPNDLVLKDGMSRAHVDANEILLMISRKERYSAIVEDQKIIDKRAEVSAAIDASRKIEAKLLDNDEYRAAEAKCDALLAEVEALENETARTAAYFEQYPEPIRDNFSFFDDYCRVYMAWYASTENCGIRIPVPALDAGDRFRAWQAADNARVVEEEPEHYKANYKINQAGIEFALECIQELQERTCTFDEEISRDGLSINLQEYDLWNDNGTGTQEWESGYHPMGMAHVITFDEDIHFDFDIEVVDRD